jgi:S-adenosylmethionine synthetase
MKKERHLFTSESVSEGHPDKLCDQISDAILDAILEQDPTARVACEAFVTTGTVVVGGEITTKAYVDINSTVRGVVRSVGYTNAEYGFDYQTCGILTTIQQQSPDIAMGVDVGGAGDQGMMFGFATDESPEYMPTPIVFAHRLVKTLAEIRKSGDLPYLRPDAKSQVTIQYEDDRPVRIDTIVVSSQHDSDVSLERISADIKERVIRRVLPREMLDDKTRILINPTGRFEIGGPHGDTGLTGRKIIVDTYGGFSRHGGGAFSGKDPTKVDRSAAYFARYVAKNLVAAGAARKCELQVAYAIGVPEPVSVMVQTFGTGALPEDEIVAAVRDVFDFTPAGIIKKLDLRRPIYRATAAYGHFGRSEKTFTWEKLDAVESLKKRLNLKSGAPTRTQG